MLPLCRAVISHYFFIKMLGRLVKLLHGGVGLCGELWVCRVSKTDDPHLQPIRQIHVRPYVQSSAQVTLETGSSGGAFQCNTSEFKKFVVIVCMPVNAKYACTGLDVWAFGVWVLMIRYNKVHAGFW